MKSSNSFASNSPSKFKRKRVVPGNASGSSGFAGLQRLTPAMSRKLAAWLSLAAVSFSALPSALAADFYVSPSGSSSGDGSSSRPWNLQTALNHPSSVKPGDTIWMKGGTYRGSFDSRLNGSVGNFITVRQAPGERVIIDGSTSEENTLDVQGSWTCFWGFELTNTDTDRPEVQWSRPHGITVNGPNTRFVNLIVHDNGQGFGAWSTAPGAEIYGCIVYNNGNSSLDHGIYTQNTTGTKRLIDNLVFNNYGYGLHLYGSESAYLRGFDIQGNTVFNNGSLSRSDAQNIIILGSNPMERIKLTDNYTYSGFTEGSVTIGSDSANRDLILQNNYFVDETRIRSWQSINSTGNTFVFPTMLLEFESAVNLPTSIYTWNRNFYFCEEISRPFYMRSSSGSRSTDFAGWKSGSGLDSSSIYAKGKPTGTKIFIRPNQYEPGRAHITIYNWDLRSSVQVDLSSVLASGTRYEIRNAQDFLGSPVLSGTYSGGSVTLPMTGLKVAAPYGLPTPAPTGPEFNVFVLIPLSPTTTPTPAPSNTAPTISTIADQVINEDGATTAIAFTVGDAETSAANLSVLGSSSNPTLVPNGNIRFGGSGANRTVAVDPAANQTGVSTISVSVMDGSLITTRAFKLTVNPVNDAPSISSIANQSISVNGTTAALGFTIGDLETTAGNLIVSGSSSNPSLIPASGITFGGIGSSRTVTVKPAAGQTGTATISVTVNDDTTTATTTFTVTVTGGSTTPTNPAPNPGKVNIALEAESGVLSSPMGVASDTGAQQGKYIVSGIANSGTATYKVNIAAAGEYVVWCRVLALNTADRGSHDSVFFAVNGAEDVYDVAEGKWSSEWQWTLVNGRAGGQPLTINPRIFNLAAGEQTIVIRGRETGTIIDSILITNDRTFVPSNTTTPAQNQAPTISGIASQTVNEDGIVAGLSFTVADAETSADSLVVSASSSNAALVPPSGLQLTKSGGNYSLGIIPAANQSGDAVISVSVTDGILVATKTFNLTVSPVNDLPTITSIANQTISENGSTSALSFNVGDMEMAAGNLIVSGSSSNPTLVPVSGIMFGGTGSSRTVTVKPATGQSGTATITVSVNDGTASVSTTFSVTVTGISTAPVPGKVNISLEAESGTLAGAMTVVSSSGAQQGKYIASNVANSGTATYSINIPLAGEYVIWCRVLALDGAGRGNHDSVFLSIDGAEDVYDVAEGKWSNNWQWTMVNGRAGNKPLTLNPRVFNMAAGQHSLVIRGREAGTIIDSILITNDRSFVPIP